MDTARRNRRPDLEQHGFVMRWMKNIRHWCRFDQPRTCAAIAAMIVFAVGYSAPSAALNLATSPLFLTSTAKNNIMMVIDDSGSMGFEVLFHTNDGALWWNTTNQSFVGLDQTDSPAPGVINFNAAGNTSNTWLKYAFLFPNGYGTGTDDLRVYADAKYDHFAVPPLPQYAWTRSPAYNTAYFNPAVVYTPWLSYGTTTFAQSSPTAARSDPVKTDSTYPSGYTFDLTNNIQPNATYGSAALANATFMMQPGMVIPAGTTYLDFVNSDTTYNSWITASSDVILPSTGNIDTPVAISYFPATFYLPTTTTLPSGYGYIGPTLTGYDPSGNPSLNGYEIKPANFDTTADYTAAINNFANWFTYYRKRHLAMRAGVGHAFSGITNIRAGIFTINNLPASPGVTMEDLGTAANVSSFYSYLYNNTVAAGGTPSRQAVNYAGQQYQRTDSSAPITSACQQNYSVLVTDGFANVWTGATDANGVAIGDADSASGTYSGTSPYSDPSYVSSADMADIAMYYYATNLRPNLQAGQVPTNSLDSNSNPHMVLFGLGLGTLGYIYGTSPYFTVADALANPPTWQDPTVNHSPVQVDDLYHACVNSRGEMFNAANTSDIQTKLESVLNNIEGRTSSASSVAVNTRSLNTSTTIYQALFTSGVWSGDILALPVSLTGTVGAPKWSAATQLESQNWDTGRQIITWNGTSGVAFRYQDLTAAQLTVLNTNPATGTADNLGQDRLNWLRGDHSKEGTSTTDDFRVRPGGFKLGDIVDSSPIYVGAPSYLPDTMATAPHSVFEATWANREPVIYAGANDGMLHGFDANTGNEVIAYVPNLSFSGLNNLTNPNYTHQFYVDGAPTEGDAYANFPACGGTACWRSILVGGLNDGGQGYFALDVTDPSLFTSAESTNANKIALWEFPAAADSDMGYSYSQPTIALMNNGEWVAIFGNGYNSANGNAVLYIVDLQTGALVTKISVGGGPGNGLSTPYVIDANGDGVADYIYAGDLKGNMWKFDVSSKTVSSWAPFYHAGTTPVPLFKAVDINGVPQPITSQPVVGPQPTGLSGFMVYFGTGKYLESGDNVPVSSPIESFYGVWDTNPSSGSLSGSATAAVARSNLLTQTIGTATVAGQTVRTVTNYPIVNWGNTGTCSSTSTTATCMGWDEDMPVTGEMVVYNPTLVGGQLPRVIYNTLIPGGTGSCFGGSSWLMEVSPTNGGTTAQGVFDVNGDGAFSAADLVNGTTPVAGLNLQMGITTTPTLIYGGGGAAGGGLTKCLAGSNGTVKCIKQNNPPVVGRTSWRQIWTQLH